MKTLLLIVLLTLSIPALAQTGQSVSRISGRADFLKEGDTVSLSVFKHGITAVDDLFRLSMIAKVHDHEFAFTWPSEQFPECIILQYPRNPNRAFNYYYMEPGSDIHLDCKGTAVNIAGKNAGSFLAQFEMHQLALDYSVMRHKHFPDVSKDDFSFPVLDSLVIDQQHILSTHRNRINPQMYAFLLANLSAQANDTEYYLINLYVRRIDSVSQRLINRFQRYKSGHPDVPVPYSSLLPFCNNYLEYLYGKYKVDSCLLKRKNFDLAAYLHFVKCSYSGKLREQLLINAVVQNRAERNYSPEVGKALKEAQGYLIVPEYRMLVNAILANRIEGVDAFNFELPDFAGHQRRLSEFKNKVVVLDFWFTGCGNCKRIAPYLKAIEQEFKDRPVQFVSISIDKNPETWRKTVLSAAYVSPDIVNLFTAGNGTNDQTIKHYRVEEYPTLLIISKTGKIVNIKTDPRLDNGKEIRQLIEANL